MMDNYDSNMIKPVEGLENISGMAPTRRREQRKKRQNYDSENKEEKKKYKEEESMIDKFDEPLNFDDADDTTIDFCA